MPTADLKVQGDGEHLGYTSLVGATTASGAVDDSAGTDQDGDTSYFLLGNPQASGRLVSFRMFEMAEHLAPLSIVLRVCAKKIDGAPEVFIGFNRDGAQAYHDVRFLPTASYSVSSKDFPVNPFNSQPWTEVDMVGLEPCVMMADFTFASCRITLLSGQINYIAPFNHDDQPPRSASY